MVLLKPEFEMLIVVTDEKKRGEEKGNNARLLKTYSKHAMTASPTVILNKRNPHAYSTLPNIIHIHFDEVHLN